MNSDEHLYERLLAGDMRAFDLLYERYERTLFGFIHRYLRNTQESEDVFHETFMAMLRDKHTIRQAHSVRAWLYQVARNLCLNRMRSHKRAQRAFEATKSEPAVVEHPDSQLEQREISLALAHAVDRLPTPLSEVYHLRANGLGYEEISNILGVPLGTVKSRMHDMVSRLREEMEQ